MSFNQDRLKYEKSEPVEGSGSKLNFIPLMMFAALMGFGAAYLGLQTNSTSMDVGDSRVPYQEKASSSSGGGEVVSLASLMEKGKQIFTTTCQACHQATGMGIPGAFPPLGGSEWVNGPAKRMVAIVIHGIHGEIEVKGEKYNNIMTTFGDQLSSEDIASVVTYVRNSFGNENPDPITPSLVDQVREGTKDQKTPWEGGAALDEYDWE